MRARRLAAAAALSVALAVGASTAGGGFSATAKPKQIWVGTLYLSYFRHFESPRPNGVAVEKDSRTLTITNKNDGTATATGSIRSRTSYPCLNGAFSGRVEEWAVGAKVRPVTVSFVKDRYQIGFTNPSSKVTIQELDCTQSKPRVVGAFAMNAGFQLYGRAAPGAKRLTGEWKQAPACAGSCVSHSWRGRWDLRPVTVPGDAKGGGGGGAGGEGGGSGEGGSGGAGGAGAGCEARVRDGTPGDDVLQGTAAAELIRGVAGDDRIAGLAGADCLRGGAGDDVLQGGLGRDLIVGDGGKDVLDGGPGNDELRARDGVAEAVRCGAGGDDTAIVDASDRVTSCETVRR